MPLPRAGRALHARGPYMLTLLPAALSSASWRVLPVLLSASPALAQAGTTQDSAIADMFRNAGPVGYVIVLMSVVAIALVIEDFVTIQRQKLAPPRLVLELDALLEDQNFQGALELCEKSRTYLTNVVAAGLGKLGHPFETIQTALREMEEEEAVKLFQKVGWLSFLNATAPLLGLFGTVVGMFVTFGEIAGKGGSVSPADLAYGIKSALVTTIFGLTVAIPVGLFFFLLRNRVVRTTIEVNAIAEDLFERFRKK